MEFHLTSHYIRIHHTGCAYTRCKFQNTFHIKTHFIQGTIHFSKTSLCKPTQQLKLIYNVHTTEDCFEIAL